jgi:hypothetical protein
MVFMSQDLASYWREVEYMSENQGHGKSLSTCEDCRLSLSLSLH